MPGVPPEDWADWQPARGGIYHRVRDAHGAVSLAFTPANGPDVRLAPLAEQGWNEAASAGLLARWVGSPHLWFCCLWCLCWESPRLR